MDDYVIVKKADFVDVHKNKLVLSGLIMVVVVLALISIIELIFCVRLQQKVQEQADMIKLLSNEQRDIQRELKINWEQQKQNIVLIKNVAEYVKNKTSVIEYNAKNRPFNER